METQHGSYTLSDDPTRLDPRTVHGYLSRSYWSENIPLTTVEAALKNSLCVGAYTTGGAQIGLVRVISDYATFAYLCDVYVLEEHRGSGLAKAMLRCVIAHPRLQGLRSWNLRTRDAHPLYAQFGFNRVEQPETYMVRRDKDVYRTNAEENS